MLHLEKGRVLEEERNSIIVFKENLIIFGMPQYSDPRYSQYQDPYGGYSQGNYPQYQNVPVSQDEMAATLIQEERIRNILSQINPDNQLFEIEMRIKGYRKDMNSNAWVKIDVAMKEPSPLLVGRYISYLSSLLNQNTSISNLSENQINKLMKLVIEYIVDDLDSNAEEYEGREEIS